MQASTSPSLDTLDSDGFRDSQRFRLFVLRLCVLAIFVLAIWFWPVGPQYVAVAPSFSCATATLATEKTICADPLLEKVDADFAVYYQDNLAAAALFQATDIEASLKKSEADFIVARDQCGAKVWCIERQYLYQDIRIGDMSGEPHRVTEPLRVYVNHYVGAYLESWVRALANSRREVSHSKVSVWDATWHTESSSLPVLPHSLERQLA